MAYSRQLPITIVLLVYKFKFLHKLFSVENDTVKHFYDISGHELVTVCQELGLGVQFCKSTHFRFHFLVLNKFCSNVLS